MNENKIVEMYKNDRYTLRHLAEVFETNHHKIKRILLKNGVKITRRNTLKEFSKTHRDNISKACKGRAGVWKGKKMSREHTLKNMKAHLKYDVSLEWLSSFEDIEKLKYLNRSLSKKRDCEGFTTEIYKQFIEKFYEDKKFNELYTKWLETKDKWIKPSLDHIQAKARGGTLLLDNLQFVSWLENRAKADIKQDEWERIKKDIGYYL
jgi:hypothetical protein